jgi:hypothetical protein
MPFIAPQVGTRDSELGYSGLSTVDCRSYSAKQRFAAKHELSTLLHDCRLSKVDFFP